METDAATPRHPQSSAHKAGRKRIAMTHTLPLPDFTHERVEVITGRRSGLFITVALHSSVLGSALGGARLWTYPHWSDALGDALRLSAAMTLKNAAAGLDARGLPLGLQLIGRPFDEETLFAAGQVIEEAAGRMTLPEPWWI